MSVSCLGIAAARSDQAIEQCTLSSKQCVIHRVTDFFLLPDTKRHVFVPDTQNGTGLSIVLLVQAYLILDEFILAGELQESSKQVRSLGVSILYTR